MAQGQESQKIQTGGEIQSTGGLLKSQERAILAEIVGLEMPHSQRALLLLALDSGAKQTEAGERVGMSPRQARYWRDRFIQRRLDIFPQDLVTQVQFESLPETHALLTEEENEIMETNQEELEKMTEQPQGLENQPEEPKETAEVVEEQNQAEEEKKAKKKKKSKKDKQGKKAKKKKSAKKAKGKQKSKKAKKKGRKK